MMQVDSKTLYSASDVVSFLECEHSTALAQLAMSDPKTWRTRRGPEDEQLALIQAKGMAHERAYLDELKDSGKRVIDINEIAGKSIEKRVSATVAAMKDGYDVIYQAAFLHDSFLGYADFLVKVTKPSALGAFSYEAVDTKLAHAARAKFLIQLAFYSYLMSLIQGVDPDQMHVKLGDIDKKTATFRYVEYRYYFQHALERFLARVNTEPPVETYPHPCDKCSQCTWAEHCETQRLNDDHLSQVANISKVQIRKLAKQGISTLAALAALPAGSTIPKIADGTLERLRSQAELQFLYRQDDVRRHLLLEKDSTDMRLRGFERMPRPNPGDMFFDMEGNPLEEGGLEYLFGVWEVNTDPGQFVAFWAHNRAREKLCFEEFMDYVDDRLQKYPDAFIYHYAPYEPTALKKLMSVHGTREASVDNLLRKGKLIDLYAVVREALRVSEPSYSIKYIERFYRGKRAGDVTNAGASILFYERWKQLQGSDEHKAEADKLLQDISDYNQDDVVSTYQLREWLRELRPANMPWANELTEAAAEHVEPNAAEMRVAKYNDTLLKDLPEHEREWNEAQRFRALVYQMLAFHRREAKPEWWALFKRRDSEEYELIEDAECLGGLTRDLKREPEQEKRSLRHFYKAPHQETKLRSGSVATDVLTGKSLANLLIEEGADGLTVSFTAGAAFEPPQTLAIGPGGPVATGAQQEALFHFADTVTSGGPAYRAVHALLKRELPRIKGVKAGAPITDESGDLPPQVIEAVRGMDETCLFIQGPPGAGKTFTGSHVIVDLLKRGKRVGVTSNSHHAINNLLEGVEKRAGEQKVEFTGMKKAGTGDDSRFNGSSIIDVKKNADVFNGGAQLVAGTSWLFACEEMRETLDYLFVDEAGQMALANLVAVGLSAKNIVLLGDQMQLAQPSKGTHPGHSGDSTLDYLLDGLATIPPEQGIFLKSTYRMHPDVCGFISEAVYDGRLKSAPETSSYCVYTTPQPAEAKAFTGIRYVPVKHEGNAQSSPEEVAVVARLVRDLLSYYCDGGKPTRKLTLDDILVVAPYNVQVNELKRGLPDGARVGTVDKFQGQEAHVVILSMATSSADYLPRDIEFLFSKNRLNVAISRAKALSVLVASPDLLAVPCSTPEQMALVNTLCALVDHAGRHAGVADFEEEATA